MGIFSCDERCEKLPKIQQQLNEVKQFILSEVTSCKADGTVICNYATVVNKIDEIIEECKL